MFDLDQIDTYVSSGCSLWTTADWLRLSVPDSFVGPVRSPSPAPGPSQSATGGEVSEGRRTACRHLAVVARVVAVHSSSRQVELVGSTYHATQMNHPERPSIGQVRT
jgi:hypothetical protein